MDVARGGGLGDRRNPAAAGAAETLSIAAIKFLGGLPIRNHDVRRDLARGRPGPRSQRSRCQDAFGCRTCQAPSRVARWAYRQPEMTMMRSTGRFSALAGRNRHVTGTDLVSATRGVSAPGRRRVPLRHQLWRLVGSSRGLATLTVAVVALIGCSSALAASTARSAAPSYAFSIPTPSGSLTATNDQHPMLRLTAGATAAPAQALVWHACAYPGVPPALQLRDADRPCRIRAPCPRQHARCDRPTAGR